MPTERLVFINLPVADVQRSIAFFEGLGFGFNEKFTDESCACLVISDKAFAMLMDRVRFATFVPAGGTTAETPATTEVLIAVSAESRQGVDELTEAALAAGGSHAREPEDYGFMYGRSFRDPDGHIWEVAWMDPAAVEQGPQAMTEAPSA